MAEITLENLSKTYPGKVAAVRKLDLTIADGELLVLVGSSGCGKTTTLRLLAGLESPDEGKVIIAGREVTSLAPAKRNLALIFQEFSLYPHLTARKNIVFALKMRKLSRQEIDKRLRRAVELTGINELLQRKPGEMSGGERQRVALAGAIAREPDCLLLDEPLSNLDATSRRAMRAEIKALHQRCQMTMIHVTHDQEEAMSLGDRLAVMNKGRIHQIGPPRELYDHPADRFVAGFLGSPAMNFIEGHLRADDGPVCFHDGHGLSVAPSDRMAASLGQPRARAVTLGIRPEHLRIVDQASGVSRAITAQIKTIEHLGGFTLIHTRNSGANPGGNPGANPGAGGAELTARVEPDTSLQVGDQITLAPDPEKLHFFDPGDRDRRIATD